ncbi:MAG: segregation/condensation protein A, partial [Candidatus Hydrogenedentes bacterium]|nr:segregation/condensation protein A [Candidatus Hydrogenedentota bacterium]
MPQVDTPENDIQHDGPAPADEFIVDAATDEVLRLHLDMFEGPFEVLLYLIKSQEIDIFDIPIVKITEQYLRFLDVMREENLDVTGEFLVLAATLIQIKSKMLLPAEADQDDEEEFDEEDPRLELVEKLMEYRKFRDVSEFLQLLEERRADWYAREAKPRIEPDEEEEELLDVTLYDLISAFRGVLRYITDDLVHTVGAEEASVDEKIEFIQA